MQLQALKFNLRTTEDTVGLAQVAFRLSPHESGSADDHRSHKRVFRSPCDSILFRQRTALDSPLSFCQLSIGINSSRRQIAASIGGSHPWRHVLPAERHERQIKKPRSILDNVTPTQSQLCACASNQTGAQIR